MSETITYTGQYLHLNCHLFGFFPGSIILTGSCQCRRVSLLGPRRTMLFFCAASSRTFLKALSPSDANSVLILESESSWFFLDFRSRRLAFRYFTSGQKSGLIGMKQLNLHLPEVVDISPSWLFRYSTFSSLLEASCQDLEFLQHQNRTPHDSIFSGIINQ